MRAVNRHISSPGIHAFGFDEESFWTKLDQATSAYRERVRTRNRRLWSLTQAELAQRVPTAEDLAICQSRVATLDSVRDLFRSEGFDRFLYTVVAPTISVSTTASRETPEKLLRIERGCQ
jgi:hypothetical protein